MKQRRFCQNICYLCCNVPKLIVGKLTKLAKMARDRKETTQLKKILKNVHATETQKAFAAKVDVVILRGNKLIRKSFDGKNTVIQTFDKAPKSHISTKTVINLNESRRKV